MTHCFEGVVNFVTDELDDGVTFIPIQYSDIIRDICEGLINTLLRFTKFKQNERHIDKPQSAQLFGPVICGSYPFTHCRGTIVCLCTCNIEKNDP